MSSILCSLRLRHARPRSSYLAVAVLAQFSLASAVLGLFFISLGMCRAFAVPPQSSDAPYKLVIDAFGTSSKWQDAVQLLLDMRTLDPLSVLNAATYTAVIAACGCTGQWVQALLLLKQAREEQFQMDVPLVTAAISACLAGGRWGRALETFAELSIRNLKPDEAAYSCAMEACIAGQFWEEALELLFQADTNVTLLPAVEACKQSQRWDIAICLLEEFGGESGSEKAEGYRSILASCRPQQWVLALSLLQRLEDSGLQLRPEDLTAALHAVAMTQPEAKKQDTEQLKKQKVRERIERNRGAYRKDWPGELPRNALKPVVVTTPLNLPPEGEAWSFRTERTILDEVMTEEPRTNRPWSELGPLRPWQMVLVLLERLQANGKGVDRATMNSAIAACARAQQLVHCAPLFSEMQGSEIEPDAMTFANLIGGFTRRGLWEQALALFAKAKKKVPTPRLYHAVLEACVRGQQPRTALLIMAEMDGKGRNTEDQSSWVTTEAITASVAACARLGLWKQTLGLLEQLKLRDLEPSTATYAAVIDSWSYGRCSETWELALTLLEEVRQSGLQLDGSCYSGAVMATGHRWELAISAVKDMYQMRIVPTLAVYTHVLQTCRAAGHSDLAVRVLEAPLREDLDSG